MSGGLTSYPRTGSSGGPVLPRIRQLQRHLQEGSGDVTAYAQSLIAALAEFSRTTDDHVGAVALAVEVRNSIYVAYTQARVAEALHRQAMALCAEHWRRLVSLATSGFGQEVDRALAELAKARTAAQRRAWSERLGSLAWLYQMSALLGEDLSAKYRAACQIGNSNYRELRNRRNQLEYLECGASYNINHFVRIEIPGCAAPLVVAGEAKGGRSRYGVVKVPLAQRNMLRLHIVSQRSPKYAVTRAYYMNEANSGSPIDNARKEAGASLLAAYREERLVYLAVRGRVADGRLDIAMEIFT